jgi:hypothetical protein
VFRNLPSAWNVVARPQAAAGAAIVEATMNQIIYLVGLIVVILAILSFVGLR